MICKAKVHCGDGTYRKCLRKAMILGLCTNHYTMVLYGKNVHEPLKRKIKGELND